MDRNVTRRELELPHCLSRAGADHDEELRWK